MHHLRKPIDRNFLKKALQDGHSATQIATQLGRHIQSVMDYIHYYGLPYRKANYGAWNPAWKGGARIDKNGYRLVWSPEHPYATKHGKTVREHRLVMEKKLGRYLKPSEVVHHIDGDKLNNHPDNLGVFQTNRDHLRHELTGRIPKWSARGILGIALGRLQAHVRHGHHISAASLALLKKHDLAYTSQRGHFLKSPGTKVRVLLKKPRHSKSQ